MGAAVAGSNSSGIKNGVAYPASWYGTRVRRRSMDRCGNSGHAPTIFSTRSAVYAASARNAFSVNPAPVSRGDRLQLRVDTAHFRPAPAAGLESLPRAGRGVPSRELPCACRCSKMVAELQRRKFPVDAATGRTLSLGGRRSRSGRADSELGIAELVRRIPPYRQEERRRPFIRRPTFSCTRNTRTRARPCRSRRWPAACR